MAAEAPERPESAAGRTGRASATGGKAPAWIGYFDLAILALALPIFLAAGFPLLGWVTGAGVWLVQRGIQALTERRAEAADDVRTRVGITAASMIARGWLAAGAILGVGLADNDAGLAAAVLFIVVFTVYFPLRMIVRSYARTPETVTGRERGSQR